MGGISGNECIAAVVTAVPPMGVAGGNTVPRTGEHTPLVSESAAVNGKDGVITGEQFLD